MHDAWPPGHGLWPTGPVGDQIRQGSTAADPGLLQALQSPALCTAGTDKQYLHGWERQFQFLFSKWAAVPQSDRIPQVMWRGRTEDAEFPKRDAMR